MAKVRDMFPGGNTAEGFYSYYDYIIEKDANRKIVIKGGPGVGKSSLMKKIGAEMLDRGYDIELHHCSSDNESLDGLVIPKLRVAFLDGTAPHVVDPVNPGAVDEIINLGNYWNFENMEKDKNDIIRCNKEVGRLFKRAYKYLAAAKYSYETIEDKNKEALEFGLSNVVCDTLIKEIFCGQDPSVIQGEQRHMFGSAYTPNGWIEYTESFLQDAERVYFLKGDIGTGKTTIMRKVYKRAIELGYFVEVYHTPLKPHKIESIYIPKLKVSLTSSNSYRTNNFKVIDLESFLVEDIVSKYQKEIEADRKIFEFLISTAISNISTAKKMHDIMEKYYIPNMDFEQVDKLRERLIQRILKYEK
ncbi:PRK06851 family protein [Abyssisolibacter fermentans]|uniref:PRK06851 family protein n=1 Tax=Abyssisolibacter fermentans TaxID=1766203 RepID=UPI00082B90F0|nr:PRK06851 family protein [Abyssisolibacter fermentans]